MWASTIILKLLHLCQGSLSETWQHSLQVKNFTEHLEEKISEQHVLQERALMRAVKKLLD